MLIHVHDLHSQGSFVINCIPVHRSDQVTEGQHRESHRQVAGSTGELRVGRKWVGVAPNRTNMGLFKIGFQ